MSFGHPKVLWVAAVILPLLGLFLWATWRKRQALIRAFVQNKSLAQLTLGTSTFRQKLRRVLLLGAVGALLFTMARPQWGFIWEEATQRGRDIIVAIDTSRSMLAEDIQPNRLTRAKLAALDLLKLGKFDRFGLVAFSGTAFLQCPLTFDDEAFRQSVQILQPGIIPQGGTALSEAIEAARRAFSEDGDDNHKVLILFTDGEDHEAGALQTATRAAEEGLRIFTVGVGSAAGELLRVRDDGGNLNYVKDDSGNVVKSRLNEQLLKEIASKSGGFYLPLQGGMAMQVLYEKGLAPMPTTERSSKLMKRLRDQFYWPLSIAILLLIIEVFIPEQKKTAQRAEATKSVAAAPAIAVFLLLICVPMTHGSSAKAQRHYKSGEYKSALSEYQEAIAKSPEDPRLRYNAGAAAYQANKFDEALKQFQAAVGSSDIDLQQQSFYNLGNSEYRLGESTSNPQERMALWEQAVQHYEAALKIRPADKDAEFNRDFVRQKLEELKQQQQQQQDKNQKSNEENKEEQNNQDEQKQEDQSKQDQQKDNSEQNKQQEQKQQQQESNESKQQPDQPKEPKDEKSDSQQASQGDKQSDQQEPKDEGQGEAAQLGKMTPAQAKQLLDAQKGEEKALLFIPPDRKSTGQNRTFKDW